MAKKKQNGAGTVKKLPSGTWRGQLMDGYHPDGRKNIINFTAPTKGEVQSMIRNYWFTRDELQVHTPIDEPTMEGTSFSEWADIWYADSQTQVQPIAIINIRLRF